MAKSILGVPHVTAIAGDLDPNLDFYTRLLGLRFSQDHCEFRRSGQLLPPLWRQERPIRARF
jgi:catechol 2,3-dioxygenase-like lactoylglutathione lyase family enzyme